MCYKKGSDLYSIPFDIPFTYNPLQIDSVPQSMQVEPTRATRQTNVETIEAAVQLYLEAFGKQFSEGGLHTRKLFLGRFVTFLKSQGHSMQLADLTLEDGQRFLDWIARDFHGGKLSPATKKRYKRAIRSFSRFLANSDFLEQDLFFTLIIE